MARTEIERTVQPSLLDRLTDLEPKMPSDSLQTREQSERAFRAAVQRDVEALLNTRRTIEPAPDECPQVHASVYEYGLLDTTTIAVSTSDGRDALVAALEDAVSRFEPRLVDARVRLVDGGTMALPELHFQIEATLMMDPSPEQVMFDTVLEISNGEYDVRGADDRR